MMHRGLLMAITCHGEQTLALWCGFHLKRPSKFSWKRQLQLAKKMIAMALQEMSCSARWHLWGQVPLMLPLISTWLQDRSPHLPIPTHLYGKINSRPFITMITTYGCPTTQQPTSSVGAPGGGAVCEPGLRLLWSRTYCPWSSESCCTPIKSPMVIMYWYWLRQQQCTCYGSS